MTIPRRLCVSVVVVYVFRLCRFCAAFGLWLLLSADASAGLPRDKLEKVLADAQARQQLAIISITASWSPACRSLPTLIDSDAAFKEFTSSKVFLHLDETKDSEARRLCDKFRISIFPAFLVLFPDGAEMGRIVGYLPREQLVTELKAHMADASSFGRLLAREKTERLPPTAAIRLMREFADRSDFGEVLKRSEGIASDAQQWPANLQTELHLLEASAYFQTGQYEKALGHYDRFTNQNSDDVRMAGVLIEKTRALISLRRYSEAVLILQQLLDDFANDAAAQEAAELQSQIPMDILPTAQGFRSLVNQGFKLLSTGKYTAALPIARQAVETAVFKAEPHLLMAQIHLKMSGASGDPIEKNQNAERFREELRIARMVDPGNYRAYSLAKELLAAKLMPQNSSIREAQKLFEQAQELLASGKGAAAAEKLAGAIQADAHFSKAHGLLGEIHLHEERSEKALEEFAQAAKSAPLDPFYHHAMANVYGRLHRGRDQFEALLRALAADPEYPGIWEALQSLGRRMRYPLERHNNQVPLELLNIPKDSNTEAAKLYMRVHAHTIPAWKEYARIRLLWRSKKFFETHPAETQYRLTAKEEKEALAAAAAAWRNLKQAQSGLQDPTLDFLDAVEKDQKLQSYIFIERFSEDFREEFESWKQEQPAAIAEYLSQWLFPLPQAKTPPAQSNTEVIGTKIPPDAFPQKEDSHGLKARSPEEELKARSQGIRLFSQGVVAHQANDLDRAAALYEAALKMDPSFTAAHQNLALLYFNRGNLLQAAEQAEEGALRNPQNAALIYLATQSYIQLQLYERAVLLLRQTARRPLESGEKASVLDRLAYVFIQMQEWDKAEKFLKEAVNLDANNEEIAQHMSLLQKMKAGSGVTLQKK